MSNGFGVSQSGGKRMPNGYAQLASVPPPKGSTPDALTDAATAAVRRLAKANGHPLPANIPTGSGQSFLAGHRAVILAAVVALVALLGALAAVLFHAARRRGTA